LPRSSNNLVQTCSNLFKLDQIREKNISESELIISSTEKEEEKKFLINLWLFIR